MVPPSDRKGASDGVRLEVPEIAALLPHRFPFLLLDRVVELEPGRRIVAIKNVTANELYFLGHFPGQPVMPGVLVCEALAQAGAVLAHRSGEGIAPGSVLLLRSLDRARFRRPVVPGDQLRLEVVSVHRRAPLWRMRGLASVEGERVAEVEFSAAEVERRPAPGGALEAEVRVHTTAVVAPGAELDFGVEVGPYAVIGPEVRVGRGTWIGPHAVIEGRTQLGAGNRVFQFATVGSAPQDLKYRGEQSRLIIGDDNTIREFASLNPGTEGGGMETRVGDHNLVMIGAHVAHDCRVGSCVILANNATLAGHVTIEDYVIVGGLVGVHQFVRIGESAIIGAGSMVSQDVPPYCNATGDRARLRGLNVVGLRRRGFGREQVQALKHAYRTLFLSGLSRTAALERVRAELGHVREVEGLLGFIERSRRGICRAARGGKVVERE